ncbi:MAG TPA: sulfurtransferase, partial [Gammaproteobacteria bacterium]|nr:sulfurtransferase [Gammaproteobacteria bacterium]
MNEAPILITTEELDDQLDNGEVRVVDLSKLEHYASSHIPGATHLDYVTLLDGNKPAPGQLPPGKQLEQLSAALGLSDGCRIIACDDEGSGRAARLVWTLHVMGYPSCSVLDGGMTAWRNEHRRLSVELPVRENTAPTVAMDTSVIATREYILSHLNDDQVILVDARTPEEYIG